MRFNLRKTAFIFLGVLVLGIYVRLIDINLPLIDHHSYRQCDTAMIARNFYEEEFNILYPKIDYRGATQGYIECEFPLYNFIVAILYKIFQPSDVIARLTSVVFSVGTIIFLYFIAMDLYNIKVALWACFIFAILPEGIYFTHTVMPESAMLFFTAGSMFFLLKWIASSYIKDFIFLIVFLSLSFLVKLPTMYLFLPIAYCVYQKYGVKSFTKFRIWLLFISPIIPVVLWYLHTHYNLQGKTGLTFGIWSPSRLATSGILLDHKFYKVLFERLRGDVMTDVGIALFLLGFIFGVFKKHQNILRMWVFSIFIYFMIAAQSNYRHDYYQLPIVLPASIFIGVSFNFLFSRNKIEINGLRLKKNFTIWIGAISLFFLLFMCWESTGNFFSRKFWNLYNAGKIADKMLPKDNLVITCCDGVHLPEILYYTHRKGWHVNIDTNPDYIMQLIDKNAKYFVLVADDEQSKEVRNLFNTPLCSFLKSRYKIIYQTDFCAIFNLDEHNNV